MHGIMDRAQSARCSASACVKIIIRVACVGIRPTRAPHAPCAAPRACVRLLTHDTSPRHIGPCTTPLITILYRAPSLHRRAWATSMLRTALVIYASERLMRTRRLMLAVSFDGLRPLRASASRMMPSQSVGESEIPSTPYRNGQCACVHGSCTCSVVGSEPGRYNMCSRRRHTAAYVASTAHAIE